MPILPKPTQMKMVPLSNNNRLGTLQTLKIMWGLAKEGKSHVDIYHLSRQIVVNLPNKAFKQEVVAIYDWVANNIRYTQDVREVETLQTPDWTVKMLQGDCDDHAVLLAALLQSIGHPVRFVAIKCQGAGPYYVHVFTETKIGPRWVALDTTVPEKDIGFVDAKAYDPIFYSR